jgi:hypothetical protein
LLAGSEFEIHATSKIRQALSYRQFRILALANNPIRLSLQPREPDHLICQRPINAGRERYKSQKVCDVGQLSLFVLSLGSQVLPKGMVKLFLKVEDQAR